MKIDFYLLESTSEQKSLYFACQFIEKLLADNADHAKAIHVQMNSKEEAVWFDSLLWTYRDDSFLPHALYDASEVHPPLVQIAYHENITPKPSNILLNLSRQVPPFYSQFDHVIEIVFANADMQQWARQRYKQYRDNGHDISTIKLKA